jgi:Glycosyl transferase family 2
MALNVDVDSVAHPHLLTEGAPEGMVVDAPPDREVDDLRGDGDPRVAVERAATVAAPGERLRARPPIRVLGMPGDKHGVAAWEPQALHPAALPPHSLRTPTVSVVVPTLNEARNLPFVLPRIPKTVAEVILVDGRSTDSTVDVAQQLLPDVRVVMETRPGKGAALRAGFLAARGDIIVMLDADGSADPREIPHFVDALVSGADLAKGSRFIPGGGSADITPLRTLGNTAFTILVKILFGGRYTDLCYGYNAFWRSIGPMLDLDVPGFEIETMMNITALRHRLQVTEVPSFEARRIHGASNLRTFRDGWRVLRTIVRERVMPTPVKPMRELVPVMEVITAERSTSSSSTTP